MTGNSVRPSLGMHRETYRKAMAARMAAARAGSGYTQAQVAEFLGLEMDAYRKQEKQGALPTHLVEAFVDLTGVDLVYLMTGRHARAEKATRLG